MQKNVPCDGSGNKRNAGRDLDHDRAVLDKVPRHSLPRLVQPTKSHRGVAARNDWGAGLPIPEQREPAPGDVVKARHIVHKVCLAPIIEVALRRAVVHRGDNGGQVGQHWVYCICGGAGIYHQSSMPHTLEWPPPVAPTPQCTTQWSTLLHFTTSESAVLAQNNLSSLKRIEGMLGSIQNPPPFPYTFSWSGGGFGTNTSGGFRLGMLAIAVARHWNLARTYKYGTRDMVRCAQTALRCFTEATAQPWPDQETLAQTRPPTLHPLVGSYLGLAIEHCILLEEPDQAPVAARIAIELSTPSPSALVCRHAFLFWRRLVFVMFLRGSLLKWGVLLTGFSSPRRIALRPSFGRLRLWHRRNPC